MRRLIPVVGLLLASSSFVPSARADVPVKRTLKDAARTAGDAVKDSALTVGRSTKALFKHGTDGARDEWNRNARKTRQDVEHRARETGDDINR